MSTKTVQDGATMNYTNTGSAIASGDPVEVGDLVGVAADAIAATTGTGVLYMTGVHTLPKVAPLVINQGQDVYLDAGEVTNVSTANVPVGQAWEAGASAATTIAVRLGPCSTAGA